MHRRVDVGPRCRPEPVRVIGKRPAGEPVAGRRRYRGSMQQGVRCHDGIAVQRQRSRPLIVDVGGEQRFERIEEPGRLGADELVDVVEVAVAGSADQNAAQPRRGDEPSNAQQFGGGFRQLHVASHTDSSIVMWMLPPTASRRRRPAYLSWGALAAAAMLVLAACTGGDDDTAPSTTAVATTTTMPERADDGVLTIGVYLPRTGPGAPLGEPMIAAVEQAIVLINESGGVMGRDVVFDVLDEGADTGPEELLTAGVDAIVGPASSTVALSQLDATVDPASGVVSCSPSATAIALDRYPDNGFFFRTAPSDSLQMVAIARSAERTGADTVAVGYLDDPYGRGLADSLVDEIESRGRLEVLAEVGFSGDEDDLSGTAIELLADAPGAVVVLGDADDGSRLLAALDVEIQRITPPQVIVNDAIRGARQTIQGLSSSLRLRLIGVAPLATSATVDGPEGFFAAHAADCVNLIALAAVQAESDAPNRIRANMASVSTGGRVCTDFARCIERLDEGLQIDYNGASGSVELSSTTGDPVRGWFESFGFNNEGVDVPESVFRFEVP